MTTLPDWIALTASPTFIYLPAVAMQAAAAMARSTDGAIAALPLVGYVVERQRVAVAGKPAWWGLVILTTRETVAVTRAMEAAKVETQQRVLVPETPVIAILAKCIPQRETGARFYEVALQPSPMPDGTGWSWDVVVNPEPATIETIRANAMPSLNPALRLQNGTDEEVTALTDVSCALCDPG